MGTSRSGDGDSDRRIGVAAGAGPVRRLGGQLMVRVGIPGLKDLRLGHLVLDVNGTLTDRGRLLDGVVPRLARLGEDLAIHLLSADTYGHAEEVAAAAGGTFRRVRSGDEKQTYVDRLGADRIAAIGNGRNDVTMLRSVALGIVVVGAEGASAAAILAADVVTTSAVEALDLLLDAEPLAATLRP
jgi:soluble P-type ATPase